MSKITTSLFRAFASHSLLYYHHHFYYSPPLLSLSQTAEKRLAGSDGGESVVLVIVRRGEGETREKIPRFLSLFMSVSLGVGRSFFGIFLGGGGGLVFLTHIHPTRALVLMLLLFTWCPCRHHFFFLSSWVEYLSWWGIFQTKSHMMMMIHLCLLLELMARRLRARLSLLHLVFKLVFCLATYLTYLPTIWRWWFCVGLRERRNVMQIQYLSAKSESLVCLVLNTVPYFSPVTIIMRAR